MVDLCKISKSGITYAYIRKQDAGYDIQGQTVAFAFSVIPNNYQHYHYFGLLGNIIIFWLIKKCLEAPHFQKKSTQIFNSVI